VLDKFKSAKEKLSEGVEMFKEHTVEKLKEQLEQLSEAMPKVEEAGFRVMKLDVILAPSPKLVPHFEHLGPPDQERIDRVIADNPDKKMLKPLLLALAKSAQIHDAVKIKELTFSAVAISAGIPPGIKLVFTR
jgi:hypothetical protein